MNDFRHHRLIACVKDASVKTNTLKLNLVLTKLHDTMKYLEFFQHWMTQHGLAIVECHFSSAPKANEEISLLYRKSLGKMNILSLTTAVDNKLHFRPEISTPEMKKQLS